MGGTGGDLGAENWEMLSLLVVAVVAAMSSVEYVTQSEDTANDRGFCVLPIVLTQLAGSYLPIIFPMTFFALQVQQGCLVSGTSFTNNPMWSRRKNDPSACSRLVATALVLSIQPIPVMECTTKKEAFPLNELSIKLLKMFHFWNETPGKAFSRLGYLVVAIYPIAWLIPSCLFIAASPDSVTQLLKAVNEQIVFFAIFSKLCFYALNFRRWEELFYELQRVFTTVMHNPDIEIQAILGHVEKSSYFFTKYYTSLVTFNCTIYCSFPMLFVVVKYALTGSYNVPLPTPIEAKSCYD
uniref:Uncharacterized protein n=1 Tax=Anopheles farauti TaxID=69004 RepID=A0A182QSZ9_9DIPT